MSNRWMGALTLVAAVAGWALLSGAEAPSAAAKAPKKHGGPVVFTEQELDGGVIQGHYQHPEAVYVVPRSEAARKAVDSAGDHLDDALKREK